MDVRRGEGADDVHVQEVATVGGLVERLIEPALVREALGIGGYAVVAVGVDSLAEGGRRVEGVRNKSFLMRSRLTWRR